MRASKGSGETPERTKLHLSNPRSKLLTKDTRKMNIKNNFDIFNENDFDVFHQDTLLQKLHYQVFE